MNKNIDVLLWSNDVVSVSVKRVLQKYTDTTLFDQNSAYFGLLPDLVVLTATDIQKALKQRIEVSDKYPDAKIVYIKQRVDATVLGVTMLVGFDGLVTTEISGEELHRLLHALAESPKVELAPRKRANLVVQHTKDYNKTEFTLRQLAILSLLTRNLDYVTISKLLKTTTGDVYIAEGVICAKLKIPRENLRSYKMLYKYGAVEPGEKKKYYKIEPVMRRAGYFLVPRFYTEKPNK